MSGEDKYRIPVIYGPDDEPNKHTVDLLEKFNYHIMSGGAISTSDVVVHVSSYYPGYPYLKVDRTTMPSHYPCMGSVSAIVEISGQTAVMSLVNFRDMYDKHHQTWLWWRDFEGRYGYSKNVPGHQMDSSQDINMMIVTQSSTIRVTIDKFTD